MSNGNPAIPMPRPGQCWRHYKDGYKSLYEIVGVGWNVETCEAVVVYREPGWSLAQEQPLFVRPLSVFLGTTGDHKPRFSFEREAYV